MDTHIHGADNIICYNYAVEVSMNAARSVHFLFWNRIDDMIQKIVGV